MLKFIKCIYINSFLEYNSNINSAFIIIFKYYKNNKFNLINKNILFIINVN
jgi:hypothetical protein